jgi:hypothetical protein
LLVTITEATPEIVSVGKESKTFAKGFNTPIL